MRYAEYVRSSAEQVDNQSIEAQKRAIEAWIAARGGTLVGIYADDAQPGCLDDRPGFREMSRAAGEGEFDVLVVHRLDRLSREPGELSLDVEIFPVIE